MLSDEYFKKWYAVFAKSVDKHIIREHVLASGCMPWHIFIWGNVACTQGAEALKEFLEFDENQKTLVFQGFEYEKELVEDFDTIDKVSLTHLMQTDGVIHEVFITASDFSWTFVWTHEGYCFGPYLCIKKD